MSEINSRKRKLLPEKMTNEMQTITCDAQSTIENVPLKIKDLYTTSSTVNPQQISKSDFKFNFDEPWKASRSLLSKTAHSIGKKASARIVQKLHIGQGPTATQTSNDDENQDTMNSVTVSSSEDGKKQPQAGAELSRNRKRTLQKYYTLKLRKLKEQFVTKRQLRKNRFRSLQQTDPNKRFRKDLDQSRIESNKQAKLLQKLVEKHNKHLESFLGS